MIKYLKNHEIDREKWDKCISSSPNSIIYAYSWYLDIVAQNWEALVEDDYVSVFPLPIKRKFGIKYSVQPHWTQQLGLFSSNSINTEKLNEFLRAIPKSFLFYQINLNSFLKVEPTSELKIIQNNNFCLDLIYSYDVLYSAFSKNLKRNLNNPKAKVEIFKTAKVEDIVELFKKGRGKEISNLDTYGYKLLVQLIYKAQYLSLADVWGAYDEKNSLCAGAVFLYSKGRAIMIFSATSEYGKEISAMHQLISSFIKNYQQHNLVLDFEGSNIESLARFYQSFGAENSSYNTIYRNRLPIPMSLLSRFKKF